MLNARAHNVRRGVVGDVTLQRLELESHISLRGGYKLFMFRVLRYGWNKWCAKRTIRCLTAYREERSDEWCAED